MHVRPPQIAFARHHGEAQLTTQLGDVTVTDEATGDVLLACTTPALGPLVQCTLEQRECLHVAFDLQPVTVSDDAAALARFVLVLRSACRRAMQDRRTDHPFHMQQLSLHTAALRVSIRHHAAHLAMDHVYVTVRGYTEGEQRCVAVTAAAGSMTAKHGPADECWAAQASALLACQHDGYGLSSLDACMVPVRDPAEIDV